MFAAVTLIGRVYAQHGQVLTVDTLDQVLTVGTFDGTHSVVLVETPNPPLAKDVLVCVEGTLVGTRILAATVRVLHDDPIRQEGIGTKVRLLGNVVTKGAGIPTYAPIMHTFLLEAGSGNACFVRWHGAPPFVGAQTYVEGRLRIDGSTEAISVVRWPAPTQTAGRSQ